MIRRRPPGRRCDVPQPVTKCSGVRYAWCLRGATAPVDDHAAGNRPDHPQVFPRRRWLAPIAGIVVAGADGAIGSFEANATMSDQIDRPEVRDEVAADLAAFLDEYRRANEAGDVTALGTMYASFPPSRRARLARYFASVRDLRVTIDRVEMVVLGEEAVISYTRTDDFIDVPTGRPEHVSVRVTRTVRRVDGRWRFSSLHARSARARRVETKSARLSAALVRREWVTADAARPGRLSTGIANGPQKPSRVASVRVQLRKSRIGGPVGRLLRSVFLCQE